LARGPVAAQMYEYSYTENPPNCVGGIREFILHLLIVSPVLTLLLNTSRSFTLLRIIWPGLYKADNNNSPSSNSEKSEIRF
jgi:hypothetical protein